MNIYLFQSTLKTLKLLEFSPKCVHDEMISVLVLPSSSLCIVVDVVVVVVVVYSLL